MRRFKSLGIALVVMLAAGMVAAMAAAGDELTVEANPSTISGISEGKALVFTPQYGETVCLQATYAGTFSGPSTSLTVAPSFPAKSEGGYNCAIKSFPAEVDLNGCDYLFSVNGGGSTTGTAKIQCPAGKEITFTSKPFFEETVRCSIHVPEQVFPAGSVTYANVGLGTTREITASINVVEAVHYTQTEGIGGGKCMSLASSSGNWSAKVLLTAAAESNGMHAGLFLS